jgi:hypothetical protein
VECGQVMKGTKDLFCSNFGAIRGGLRICCRSWLTSCYKASSLKEFHITCPENDKGVKGKKKKEEKQCVSARRGDIVCAPFQCDHCWFANITKKEANPWYADDARKLAFIRWVNLDVMWSRELSTVGSMLGTLARAKKDSEDLDFSAQVIRLGPWPIADTCGYQITIEMLRHSQKKGKNSNDYIQFD